MKTVLFAKQVSIDNLTFPGVTYDPNPACVNFWDDVLADDYSNEWLDYESDLQDIVSMGVNSIRLYQIDPYKTHSNFLNYAQSLGLYVIPPLTGTEWGYLDASRPSPDCYTASKDGYGHLGTNLLYNAKAIIKEFSQYPNVLMYCVGNELVLNAGQTEGNCFPCLKALVRDLHAWQDECSQTMRRVPLMYATQVCVKKGRLSRHACLPEPCLEPIPDCYPSFSPFSSLHHCHPLTIHLTHNNTGHGLP